MKNLIIYLVSLLLLVSCTEDKNVIYKAVKEKSSLTPDSIVLTVTNVNGNYVFPDTVFSSPIYIKGIKVHYNEPHNLNATPRIFELGLLDYSQDSIFYPYDSVPYYFAFQGHINGATLEEQTIIYDDLNIRCNEIIVFSLVNTNKIFTATIYTMDEPDTINQVVSFILPQDYDNNPYPNPIQSNFRFNGDMLIKHITVQQWGKLNRNFSAAGDGISISSNTAVRNVKDFTLNAVTDSLNMSMVSVPPLPYSAAGYLNYGDMAFVVTLNRVVTGSESTYNPNRCG